MKCDTPGPDGRPLSGRRMHRAMWRHHHRHHHGRMGPLGRYVRARLHRRLFVWFGATIVATVLALLATYAISLRWSEPSWQRDWHQLQRFAGRQLAANWESPTKNQALLDDVAQSFNVDVELRDLSGVSLMHGGGPCAKPSFTAPVVRNDVQVGTVSVCFERRASGPGLKPLLALLVAVFVLWAGSGKIARRLARPLDELARVVNRLGEGDLKARTELAQFAPGEIGLVAEAVNEMASRIEKQMADQRELLAAVSHELRTPLARMRIITELGRDNGAQPSSKTWDDLDREAIEIDALVGQLLASSRVDFDALSMRELSIRDVSLKALERAGLPPEGLTVSATADAVTADPTLLARALANLFENAKRHAGGAVALVVREDAGRLYFEVLDSGPGLNGTDPYAEPGNGAATRGDGLGLGLKLVKRIAVAHGGDGVASTRPEGGARVGFWVPLG